MLLLIYYSINCIGLRYPTKNITTFLYLRFDTNQVCTNIEFIVTVIIKSTTKIEMATVLVDGFTLVGHVDIDNGKPITENAIPYTRIIISCCYIIIIIISTRGYILLIGCYRSTNRRCVDIKTVDDDSNDDDNDCAWSH